MRLTDPIIREGPQLKVDYVALDSLGTKSMCVCIETPDVVLTIDPGTAVEAGTFPLPIERRHELHESAAAAVRAACRRSMLVVISHYHLDHFTPGRDADLYGGKTLLAKDLADLPGRQADAAARFHKAIDGLPAELLWADGRTFRFKRTQITLSAPVWHGEEEAEPGHVIMTEVCRGREKVLVTSDVGGPLAEATTDAICAAKAETVVVDGYPTSHLGQFATDYGLVRSIVNLCRILAVRNLKTLVVDHHMARDYRYPAFFRLAYDKARQLGKTFGTAAEILGRTSAVLEGYRDYGPTRWQKWFPLEATDARAVLERAVQAGKLAPGWLDGFDRWVA